MDFETNRSCKSTQPQISTALVPQAISNIASAQVESQEDALCSRKISIAEPENRYCVIIGKSNFGNGLNDGIYSILFVVSFLNYRDLTLQCQVLSQERDGAGKRTTYQGPFSGSPVSGIGCPN
eukprot:1049234-Amphidinium_carterae.1